MGKDLKNVCARFSKPDSLYLQPPLVLLTDSSLKQLQMASLTLTLTHNHKENQNFWWLQDSYWTINILPEIQIPNHNTYFHLPLTDPVECCWSHSWISFCYLNPWVKKKMTIYRSFNFVCINSSKMSFHNCVLTCPCVLWGSNRHVSIKDCFLPFFQTLKWPMNSCLCFFH